VLSGKRHHRRAEFLKSAFFGRGEVGNMIMFYKTMPVSSHTLHEMITFRTNRNTLQTLPQAYDLKMSKYQANFWPQLYQHKRHSKPAQTIN
jgi:hypothetical protein